jgi:hypothetical protein
MGYPIKPIRTKKDYEAALPDRAEFHGPAAS